MFQVVRQSLMLFTLWALALASMAPAQSLSGLTLPGDTPFVPTSTSTSQSPPGIYPILMSPPSVKPAVVELSPPESRPVPNPGYLNEGNSLNASVQSQPNGLMNAQLGTSIMFDAQGVPMIPAQARPTIGAMQGNASATSPVGPMPAAALGAAQPSFGPAGANYGIGPSSSDPYCIAPGAMSGMGVRTVPFSPSSFLQTPMSPEPYNPAEELATYRSKYAVPVQRPWVEFWRPFYKPGIYPPASDVFGKTNLLFPHFYVYGDYRTAVGVNKNQAGNTRSWAHRLNLDMDLGLTATERIHGFMGPLDNKGQFTRLDFTDDAEFKFATDAKFDTLYFEGDAGAITGGLSGIDSPFDLPFTFGLVPLLYQNGIWMEDAVLGAAVAVPARNNADLGWANFDATFFAVGDQLTSDAFKGSNSAADALGTAWFIDAYDGYFEVDYAYVHDTVGKQRSYNNFAVAFTRRYLMSLSNSVRFISNFGQDLPAAQRTADGYLLLVENSLISSSPNTFVPYCNMFYGSGRPQSVARAAGSGGILRNTGINFETDGLTGYPTLDPTAANTYGAALGLNMLGANFRDQLVVEAAALGSYGSTAFKRIAGDQYAMGVRYQRPLSYRWIFRTDAMYGFLRNAEDIVGSRVELRWKF